MRPVLAGLCTYESIVSSTLDLADLDTLNELLDVREVNMRRAQTEPPPVARSEYVVPPRGR